MPVAAGVSAVGGLAGAYLTSSAAKSAANTYAQTAQQGIAAQEQMFGQAQGALAPYYKAGQSVLPTLQSLLTPGASQTSTLQNLPGFQFASQYGTLAAKNALAAQGLGGSTGPLAKAISDYNSGLASTYFNNFVGQEQAFAGMGSGAAGALAGAATQTGQGISNTLSNIGQAQAQGITGSASALSGGLSSLSNAALLYSLGGNGGSGGIYGLIGNNSSIPLVNQNGAIVPASQYAQGG